MIPATIQSIWDNGGKTIDRYTIVFMTREKYNQYQPTLSFSKHPEHAIGFSMWGQGVGGPHLGRQIEWTDLDIDLREHVLSRIIGE